MSSHGFHIGDVTGDVVMQAGGDIVAGNKTIIQNIMHQAARKIVTAPYKFLASYDISDRDIFFGRTAVIEELTGKIPRHKTLIINGRSGAGKSSLINAGLIPRLAENGYCYVSFREYSDPLAQLQTHMAHDKTFPQVDDHACSLVELLQAMIRQQQHRLVVVFDQFERFFVNVPSARRLRFIEEFRASMQSDLSAEEMNIVFSLREDFFGAFVSEFERVMPQFFNESIHFNLHPLSRTEAREAIMRPLKDVPNISYNIQFVDDVLLPGLIGESSGSEQIDPPHLQIVCNQLYEAVRERYAADVEMGGGVQIDRRLYEELGKTQGILRDYLDNFIARIAYRDSGRHDVLRSMLKLMIETTGTRKFVSLSDLQRGLPDVSPKEVEQHIRQLQDGRVVETRIRGEEMCYSLSHEFMVEKVQSWFDEREMQRRKAQETLERGLAEWKSTQALLNERQVGDIRKWLSVESLGEDAGQLLEKSRQTYEEQKRKDAEQERRLRVGKYILWSVIAVALVVAGILTFWAWQERKTALEQTEIAKQQEHIAKDEGQKAIRQANISRSRELAVYAVSALETDATLGFRLAEAALDAAPTRLADNALFASLEYPFYTTLKGHTETVMSAEFSPNGKQIITVSLDNTVRIWNADIGQEDYILKRDASQVESATFSPKGEWIVTKYSDKTVLFWDAATGKPLDVLKGQVGRIISTDFSSDGKRMITVSEDEIVRIWDTTTGEQIYELKEHPRTITNAEFSPDGKWVMTASDKMAWIWDAATGKQIRELKEDYVNFSNAAFSPGGERIVIDSGDSVQIWDIKTGQLVGVIEVNASFSSSAVFSPDGEQILTVSDHAAIGSKVISRVRVWNGESGEEIYELEGYTGIVHHVAYSPDGKMIVTALEDHTARVWDATTSDDEFMMSAMLGIESHQKIYTLNGHRSAVISASFSPDGKRIVTTSADKTARIWDIGMRLESHILKEETGTVRSAAFSSDGKRIVTASEITRIWDVTTGEPLHELKNYPGAVTSAAFSPDGKQILTVSEDHTIQVWDATTGEQIQPLKHPGTVRSAAFSPDGKKILTTSGKTARIWDATMSKDPQTLELPGVGFNSAAFSPDGNRIVTACSDDIARIWDATTGEHLKDKDLKGHENHIYNAEYSPDGKVIVTLSSDATARIWDAVAGKPLYILWHNYPVTNAAFSPDSKRLVTASSDHKAFPADTTRIWDVDTGEQIHDLKEHTISIASAAFSQDSKQLVTVSPDKTARIWEVDTGQQLYILRGVTNAAFLPDGTQIMTTSEDPTVRIWPATWQQALRLINEEKIRGTVRELTEQEKIQYGFPD